jgi:hypothetical protein
LTKAVLALARERQVSLDKAAAGDYVTAAVAAVLTAREQE